MTQRLCKTLKVSAETHRAIKLLAAHQDVSMAQLVTDATILYRNTPYRQPSETAIDITAQLESHYKTLSAAVDAVGQRIVYGFSPTFEKIVVPAPSPPKNDAIQETGDQE